MRRSTLSESMKTFDHNRAVEKITVSIGSFPSLILHTILFGLALVIGATHILSWDTVLLVLTTGVSLEAIYLAIFIQMSMNHQAKIIKDVEQDVDEIKVDVDEIQEDVGEIQEDVDEIQEDVDEIQKDIDAIEEDVDEIQEEDEQESEEKKEYRETLATISSDLQKLLEDIEKLKKR